MKFSFYQRSFILCLCAIFCLAMIVARACAQSQQQPALLELKACSRELRVFDNGAVVESRGSKITERRLSDKQMKKLRQLIARRPCIKERQQQTSPPPVLAPETFKLSNTNIDDCTNDWLSALFGLDEIQITMHSPDGQIGPFPVYIVDAAKEGNKKFAKRHYPRYLKPNWHRFLANISKAVGSKSFLKCCDC